MESADPDVSVVIPVFNSEGIVGQTVEDVSDVLTKMDVGYEIVLVDDGSPDGSWEVIRQLADNDSRIVAIRLLRNFGQHNANLAGLRAARGRWVVTMDDDGQNPASELPVLLETASQSDHDVVFGRFQSKEASRARTMGTRVVALMNTQIFHKPRELTVSNFRAIRRDVVDRICRDATLFPYMTGQALLYSANPGNVDVRHAPRSVGTSNYSLRRILALVVRILFSYSVVPLYLLVGLGATVALVSFIAGTIALVLGALGHIEVEGWTTLVVLLSFLQGVTLMLLAMLGEYVVRTLRQVSERSTYLVAEVVDGR